MCGQSVTEGGVLAFLSVQHRLGAARKRRVSVHNWSGWLKACCAAGQGGAVAPAARNNRRWYRQDATQCPFEHLRRSTSAVEGTAGQRRAQHVAQPLGELATGMVRWRVSPVPSPPVASSQSRYRRRSLSSGATSRQAPRQNMWYASAPYLPMPNSSVGSRHCDWLERGNGRGRANEALGWRGTGAAQLTAATRLRPGQQAQQHAGRHPALAQPLTCLYK